jgi:hypothetical protein
MELLAFLSAIRARQAAEKQFDQLLGDSAAAHAARGRWRDSTTEKLPPMPGNPALEAARVGRDEARSRARVARRAVSPDWWEALQAVRAVPADAWQLLEAARFG